MSNRNLLLRSRTKLNSIRRSSDYERLISDLSDLAISNYLKSNFSNANGGRFNPGQDDINAVRYIISLLRATTQRNKSEQFRELMYLKARGQEAKYTTKLGSLERELLALRKSEEHQA